MSLWRRIKQAETDITGKEPAKGSDDNYVTDAEKIVIGNTSGTNSGDNATNSQYSGLAASKQDTLVSGTNIKTINSNSILGSGDLVVSGSLPEMVVTRQTITADTTIASGYAGYVCGAFEIPSGYDLELAGDMEIG